MKNNEIININEKSFFYKLKKIFLNLKNKLFGEKDNKVISEMNNNNNNNNNEKNEFHEDIKVDQMEPNNDLFEKEEFIKSLDGNIEALNMLSIERLEKLEEYYQSIIDKNEEVIRRLKMDN